MSARQPTRLLRYDPVQRRCSQDRESAEAVGSAPSRREPLPVVPTSCLRETDDDCVSVDSFHSADEFPPAGRSASADSFLQEPAQGKWDTDEAEWDLEPPSLVRDLSEAATEISPDASEEEREAEDLDYTMWKSEVTCIMDIQDEASSDKDRRPGRQLLCDEKTHVDASSHATPWPPAHAKHLASSENEDACEKEDVCESVDSSDDRGKLQGVGEFAGAATVEGVKFLAAQSQVVSHLAYSGVLGVAALMHRPVF